MKWKLFPPKKQTQTKSAKNPQPNPNILDHKIRDYSVLVFYSITLQPTPINKFSGRRVNTILISPGNKTSYKAWIIFRRWTQLTPNHFLTNWFIQSSHYLNYFEELLLCSGRSHLYFKKLASSWITNIHSMMWIFFFLRVWQHLPLKHISTKLKTDSANSCMRITSKCDYKWYLNADFTNSNQLIQARNLCSFCSLSGSVKVKKCQSCTLKIIS